MKKTKVAPWLIITTLFATTVITPCLSIVSGADFNATYTGSTAPKSGQEPPTFMFVLENGTVLKPHNKQSVSIGNIYTKNLTIELIMNMDYGNGFFVNLHNVSYKASWQDEPVIFYRWSINDPADLYDDDPNGTNSFSYNIVLTEIPEGPQHLDFNAAGGGIYISFGNPNTYQTFTIAGSSSLNFTVVEPEPQSTSTPSPSPEHTLIVDPNFSFYIGLALLIIVVTTFAALLLYFKKRKH